MPELRADPAPNPSLPTVPYGPLSLRWKALGAGLLATLVGAALTLVALQRQRLECRRHGGGGGTCRVADDYGIATLERVRVPVRDVLEVRWVPYTGTKKSKRGRTDLIVRSGRTVQIADGARDEAREAHERIKRFFADPTQRTLSIDFRHSVAFVVTTLLVVLLGLVGIGWFFGGTTSLVLIPDPKAGRLYVRRSRFGVKGRPRALQAAGAREVSVEEGQVKGWLALPSDTPRVGFRLVLVDADGARHPVTPEPLLGRREVHERAARELRKLLALPEPHEAPLPDTDLAADPDNAGLPPDPPPPPAPAFWQGRNLRIALLLIAMVLGPALFFFLYPMLSGETGRLSVTCSHRCRHGTTECLPGGSFSGSRRPGTYTFEVWNPRVPGNWEKLQVEVRSGQTTHFDCRPQR